jgi:hypothetical protein
MAIADLLRTLGGKVNTGISNVGNTFTNMNAQPTGILTPEQQRALTERQQKANLLFALGDAFKGKDIGQNYLAREQNFMAMDAARQAKAREQQLRSSIANNPNIPTELRESFISNPSAYGTFAIGDLERQRKEKKEANFRAITSSIKKDDYDSYRSFYRAVGDAFQAEGYADKGLEYFKLAQPQTMEDMRADILSERKVQEKIWTPTNNAVVAFKKLEDALKQEGGTAAYSSLVLYMKGLDDSVVKEGEVRAFQDAQGLLGNIKERLSKSKGEGMTPEMKAQILNLARKNTKHMLDGFKDNRAGTALSYSYLGLPTEPIFQGYTINEEDLDFNPVTADYFERIEF